MACFPTNPLAPNGDPSELFTELHTLQNNGQRLYTDSEASRIYGAALDALENQPERYTAADLRANGELTMAAVYRLVSPLLTKQLAPGFTSNPALINTVRDKLEAKITKLVDGMRNLQKARSTDRSQRTMLPLNMAGSKLPEDTADLKLQANQLAKTQTMLAYLELMDFARKRVGTMSQLSDPNGGLATDNLDNFALISSLREELRMYTDPLNMGVLVEQNSGLHRELAALNGEISFTMSQLDSWLEDATRAAVRAGSSNQDVTGSDEALTRALTQADDVSMASRMLQSLGDSGNTLLALVGKKMREAEWTWKRNTQKYKKQLATRVAALEKAAGGRVPGLYDFMLKFKDGKRTGEYVTKESEAYLKEVERIEATMADPNDPAGRARRQFNTIAFNQLTPAEKQHNIDLADDRKSRQNFYRAEDIVDRNGQLVAEDGQHHRYTDDFKRERGMMQKLERGPHGPQWVPIKPLDGSDPNYEVAYAAFLTHYYQPEQETTIPVKANGKYTGEVLRGPARYVKPEFKTIQPQWESKGYQGIMGDTSALGLARRGFYEEYTRMHEQDVLRKLPPGQRLNMYGQVARIRKNRSDNMAESVRNGVKNFKNVLMPNIDMNVYTRSRAVDADGRYLEGIPIYGVGSLKSQDAVDTAQAEYDAVRAQRRQNPRDEDLKLQESRAREKLRAAQSGMDAEDLEYDLGRSAITFYEMAQEYHELKRAEPFFRQVLGLVEEMKFLNTDNVGNPVLDPATGEKTYGKKGQDSNTWKQLRDFLDLNVYNSVRADSLVERIGDGVLRWSGSLMQGFNVGSQVNELVSGNINQFLETRFANKWGASGFLKPGAYLNAQSIVVGGTMHKGAEEVMRLFNDPSLLDKPHDKVSAIMDELFVHQNISTAGSLKTGNKFADIGYKALNVFEFYTQSTMAVARLMSVEVEVEASDPQGKRYKTGEKKSLWEALEFNEHNGELHVPDYISDEVLRNHIVQIRSMISSIHGNYSERDKVAIQRHVLGRMAYQFKKWTYQLGRSRWGSRYYDEGLQDYREGRYRTVAKFVQNIFLTEMNVRDRWAEMSAQEKINVAKTATDLATFAGLVAAHVLIGAAAGDDDDDDALSHRLVNYLNRQVERSSMEVSAGFNPFEWGQLLKNPLPILRSLENTRAVLSDFTGVGAYYFTGDEKQIIVQRGLRKGQYKLGNSLLKLLPGGLLKGQWEQTRQSGEYFITQGK